MPHPGRARSERREENEPCPRYDAATRRERCRGHDRQVAEEGRRPRRQVRADRRGHHRQGQRGGAVALRGHADRDPRPGRRDGSEQHRDRGHRGRRRRVPPTAAATRRRSCARRRRRGTGRRAVGPYGSARAQVAPTNGPSEPSSSPLRSPARPRPRFPPRPRSRHRPCRPATATAWRRREHVQRPNDAGREAAGARARPRPGDRRRQWPWWPRHARGRAQVRRVGRRQRRSADGASGCPGSVGPRRLPRPSRRHPLPRLRRLSPRATRSSRPRRCARPSPRR